MMSAKLIEVTELEKAFSITPRPEIEAPAEVTVLPKKKRIRECADLRSFWDQDCDTACESVTA
jgi:hypothetical protein